METQELKWWHVRWRPIARVSSRVAILGGKILSVLCVLAAIGWGVLYVLQPWLFALAMSDPQLKLVPISLPSNAQAHLSGAEVEHFGFRLQLPSEAFRKGKDFESTAMSWSSNGGFVFRNPAADEKDWPLWAAIHNDKDAETLLGGQVLHSKFLAMQSAMSMTPDQVKWWRFRTARNERAQLLLMAKFFAFTEMFAAEPSSIRSIYIVSAGRVHGFQFGNPDVAPYEAHLDLFNAADQHLRFDISGPRGHGRLITQEELNAMVSSIVPESNH